MMSEPKPPFTVFDARLLVERLRRRAKCEEPGLGFEGSNEDWSRRTAVSDACTAVADEIEQTVGRKP